jgi:hypothetical protein
MSSFLMVRPLVTDDAALTSSDVPESETQWDAVTTWAKGAHVRGLDAGFEHRLYESVQAGNTNHNPSTDGGTWWIEVGPTNRWAMFDDLTGTQTIQSDSVEVEIALGGLADTLALLNISAAEVEVTMTDPLEGVVFNEMRSLVSVEGINDYWAYFFEPIVRSNYALFDLPPYYGASLTVTVENPGSVVKVGSLITGLSREIGTTLAGATVGIRDFSRKEQNAFGDYEVVERPFSQRASFNVFIANALVDPTLRLLSDYRAVPVLWIGSEQFSATVVFGFFKEANLELAGSSTGPDNSLFSVDIEGLTIQ